MVLDNPDLIVACVVGDGEAETGPLARRGTSNKFINLIRDGAVLPILNLNGYKIANPTILARISHEELEAFFVGCGYKPTSSKAVIRMSCAPDDGGDAGRGGGRDSSSAAVKRGRRRCRSGRAGR